MKFFLDKELFNYLLEEKYFYKYSKYTLQPTRSDMLTVSTHI